MVRGHKFSPSCWPNSTWMGIRMIVRLNRDLLRAIVRFRSPSSNSSSLSKGEEEEDDEEEEKWVGGNDEWLTFIEVAHPAGRVLNLYFVADGHPISPI